MRAGGEVETDWPPAGLQDEEPVALLDRAYGELVAELTTRDPADRGGTWYPLDPTVGFWFRRMAQESVIHRIDAELGAGVPIAPVPHDLAVDGIDELLKVFVAYSVDAWGDYFTEVLAGSPARVYRILTTAAADEPGVTWLVRTSPGHFTVEGGPGEKLTEEPVPDVTIGGAPTDVLRWSWNRGTPGEPSRVTVDGSPDALAEFRRCVVIATQLVRQAADNRRGRGRAEDPLRRHRAEEAFERDLDVLAPAERRPEFHAEAGVAMVRADRLEAHCEQVVNRENAGGRGPLLVTKGLDRPHAAPGEVLRHALNEHAAKASAGELAEDPGRHEENGVSADRARGKGDRPGHVLWGSE
jgi:hypothetical protein